MKLLSDIDSLFLFFADKDTKRYQLNETSKIIETTDLVAGGYFVRVLVGNKDGWETLGVMSEQDVIEWVEAQ